MERLDLRLVEYFVAVAEELHFGRAAERLHIAQPSLSQQIRRLEAQLGVRLLERDSRNVELTPAGEVLLREGRKLLRDAERTLRAARSASTRELRVGFYGTAGSELLPETLREFAALHPSVTVSIHELLLGSIDEVLEGRVDLAFTRLLPGQTELEIEVLSAEPRLVAVAKTHRLSGRGVVDFADLGDESFIVNPAVDDGDRPSRWLAEQRRHGLPGRVAAKSSSVKAILALVAAGRGVCLLPEAVARQYPREDVAYVRVSDAEPAVVSLAWAPGSADPEVALLLETARRVAAGVEGTLVEGDAV